MPEGAKEKLAASVKELKDVVTNGLKGESEKREEFEKRVLDIIEQKKADDKEDKSKNLPDDAPLDEEDEKVVNQKGGLFGGRNRLPLQKALALSVNNSAIRGTGHAEQLGTLQDLQDACAMKFMRHKAAHDETTAYNMLAKDPEYKAYTIALERAGYAKANEIQHPGSGGQSNLNFTLLSAQLFDKVRIEWILADQFRNIPLTRPQQSFPTLTADTMGKLGGSSATAPPPTDTISSLIPPSTHFEKPTFSQVQFAVSHCLGYLQFNDDMVEDSVVPWLPIMREQAATQIARAIDQALLDGDETATHQDGDVSNAYDFRKAFYGLRKMANTSARRTSGRAVDCSNGALTSAFLRDMRKQMGIYGRNPSELFYCLSMSSYYDILADDDIRTWEKHGEMETQRTGVVDRYNGIDIVLSEFVREDLSDDGTQGNGTGTDRSVAYIANRSRFLMGQYGQVDIESTRWAPMLYTIVQADVRVDFQPIEGLTSGSFGDAEAPVAIAYDIAT